MLNHYDPERAPNPKQWLALDEDEQAHLVEKYHRAHRIKLPDIHLHAMFHAVIERQIAENLAPVVRAMKRLVVEDGLSRHEAIHAIASVLVGHMHELLNPSREETRDTDTYLAEVERLTAQSWFDNYG